MMLENNLKNDDEVTVYKIDMQAETKKSKLKKYENRLKQYKIVIKNIDTKDDKSSKSINLYEFLLKYNDYIQFENQNFFKNISKEFDNYLFFYDVKIMILDILIKINNFGKKSVSIEDKDFIYDNEFVSDLIECIMCNASELKQLANRKETGSELSQSKFLKMEKYKPLRNALEVGLYDKIINEQINNENITNFLSASIKKVFENDKFVGGRLKGYISIEKIDKGSFNKLKGNHKNSNINGPSVINKSSKKKKFPKRSKDSKTNYTKKQYTEIQKNKFTNLEDKYIKGTFERLSLFESDKEYDPNTQLNSLVWGILKKDEVDFSGKLKLFFKNVFTTKNENFSEEEKKFKQNLTNLFNDLWASQELKSLQCEYLEDQKFSIDDFFNKFEIIFGKYFDNNISDLQYYGIFENIDFSCTDEDNDSDSKRLSFKDFKYDLFPIFLRKALIEASLNFKNSKYISAKLVNKYLDTYEQHPHTFNKKIYNLLSYYKTKNDS